MKLPSLKFTYWSWVALAGSAGVMNSRETE